MFTIKDRITHHQGYRNNSHSLLSKNYSNTTKLVLGSILAAFAAIFQSAGILGGIGYVLSIITTLPIVLSAMISIRIGLLAYFLTIVLLAIIQPSELFVFPFTTGLLGVCLGMAFWWWKSWIMISLFSGIALTAGIVILLYVFQFPVLGPSISKTFDIVPGSVILLFSLIYSLIWMELSKRVSRFIFKSKK